MSQNDTLNKPDAYQAAITKSNFDGKWTSNSVIVTLSIALGLYNSIEMQLLILSTFKKWKGLYFWSLNMCNFGVLMYSLGMMLLYYNLCVLWLGKVINDIGWVFMIFCQSLVLYSRLNLILESVTRLKMIKWYIIINSIIIMTVVITCDFGTTYSGKATFAEAYFYIEHIQMTAFTVQEVLISSVYVYKTIQLLRIIQKANTRSMIWQLLAINVIIIAMDITLIVLQFKHLQLYQESIKAFVYSVKLKLELNILSKLVDLVHAPQTDDRSMTLATIDSETIVGQAQREVKREMSGQDFVTDWLGNDEKNQIIVKQFEGSQASHDTHSIEQRPSPSSSSQPSEPDAISRVRSHNSNFSTRAQGRESDMMYAQMLRSISHA